MNIVGLLSNDGFTINAFPTLLNALTNFASGTFSRNSSINDLSRLVKYFKTPLTGGASAIGFVVSITVFPGRLISDFPFANAVTS